MSNVSQKYAFENGTVAKEPLTEREQSLLKVLEFALADAEARLYMLPISGRGISEQKDILSAQISRYRGAIREVEP